ncbi:HNH endonuclease [Aeromonas salmonicida]|uniref:HNH endonuclease n=1 Tax=Aeromonas salmonicida TaxID=645 RepID=UPI001F421BE0|nr:HNH endonuclease [Aeromonas salmonicida]MCE9935179.1 HNH endonuclease [Aeromonas salmonicida]
MNLLDTLNPKKRATVISMVEKAGIDTSGWRDYDGKHPSQNPSYCYEWVFKDGENILLTIWWKSLRDDDGIYLAENYRADWINEKPSWKSRASNVDKWIRYAFLNNLDLQVMVISDSKCRLLDDVVWHVEDYDELTGSCRIIRGPRCSFVDQFEENTSLSKKYEVNGHVYERKAEVRTNALKRAAGKCEYCGLGSFRTASGAIYLESHHIVPLSHNGADTISNVIALCPTHHREAHYGEGKDMLAIEFKKILSHKLGR